MPIINKPPQIVERKYQLEDLVADAAEQIRRLDRQHARSRRQFSRQDDALERQGLLGLAKSPRTHAQGRDDQPPSQGQKHDPTHPQLQGTSSPASWRRLREWRSISSCHSPRRMSL